MDRGRLSAHERWVVLTCLGAALVVAVGLPLFYPLVLGSGARQQVTLLLAFLLGTVPSAAALAAAVLTRVPGVALGIGVLAAVTAAVVGLLGFRASGGGPIGLAGVGGIVVTSALGAVPLVAADLLARRGPFTMATGALAGLLVAVLRAVVPVVTVGLGSGLDGLRTFGPEYLALEAGVPTVVLVATGAVAGRLAQATRAGRAG